MYNRVAELQTRMTYSWASILLYDLHIFPSSKRWIELNLLRAGHRRRGQLEVKDEKIKHALG